MTKKLTMKLCKLCLTTIKKEGRCCQGCKHLKDTEESNIMEI